MQQLFNTLGYAVEGSPAVAVGAAIVWGILSIILSPCHLASLPLIVGFIDDQGRISTKRAFLISLVFALGILVTIGIIGVICAVLWTGLYTLTDVFVDRNKYIKMRTAGLYKDDEKQAARQSHQNKSVQKMYANLNTQPLQPLAEELFHTRYVDRTAL